MCAAEDELQSCIMDWSIRDELLFLFMSPMIENELLPSGKYKCMTISAVVLLGCLILDCSNVQPVAESSQILICWDHPGLLKDLHFAGLCLF